MADEIIEVETDDAEIFVEECHIRLREEDAGVELLSCADENGRVLTKGTLTGYALIPVEMYDSLEEATDDLEEEVMRADAQATISYKLYETLKTIQHWDCLNPPRTDLLGDLAWLKKLVDAALAPSQKSN